MASPSVGVAASVQASTRDSPGTPGNHGMMLQITIAIITHTKQRDGRWLIMRLLSEYSSAVLEEGELDSGEGHVGLEGIGPAVPDVP